MRGLVLPLGIAVLWEILARSPAGDPLYSPSLAEIAAAWAELALGGELWLHLRASWLRFAGGFLLAAAVAIPAGAALGYWRSAREHLMPSLDLLRSFPSITLVPLAIVWLGIGDLAKTLLVAYACVWPILLNTMTGVRETSPTLLAAARTMELSRPAVFRKLLLPSALPAIATGMRLSLAVSVIVLIVSEMVAASSGIGFLIVDSERNYRTGAMFAGVLTMGLLGWVLNTAAARLERLALRYRSAP